MSLMTVRLIRINRGLRADSAAVSSTYDFVSSGEGDYKFEPSNVFQYMSPNGGLLEIIADHQPTNLKLSGLLSKPVETAEGSIEKRATFVGCSASQQSDINTAVGNADKYSENAYQQVLYFFLVLTI